MAVIVKYLLDEFWIATLKASLMLLFVGAFCHYFACAWYAIGAEGGWVLNVASLHPVHVYCLSFHWVFSLFTPSPPPAQIKATNLKEELFLIFLLMCGLVLFTSFMGRMTANVTSAVHAAAGLAASRSHLHMFMEQNHVSRELSNQIMSVANHHKYSEPCLRLDQVEAFKGLPGNLSIQLRFEVFSSTLCAHPLWARLLKSHATPVASMCGKAITEVMVQKDEDVISVGMQATKMFFVRVVHNPGCAALEYFPGDWGDQHDNDVQPTCGSHDTFKREPSSGGVDLHGKGSVQNLASHHKQRYVLHMETGVPIDEGEWFGEASLWLVKNSGAAKRGTSVIHEGTVTATCCCELLQLDAAKFREVLREEPTLIKTLQPYAQGFANAIHNAAHMELWGNEAEIQELLDKVF